MQHRKTRRRFDIPGQARFITCSCLRRQPFFGSPDVCDLFVGSLARARIRQRFELHAWVVMPEHVHLVLTPSLPDHQMSRVLGDLKGTLAARVLGHWRNTDSDLLDLTRDTKGRHRFWQPGGGYDRNLGTQKA